MKVQGLEKFFFLRHHGEKVFAAYHEPASDQAAAALLMVHPFAEEKLWAGRMTTLLARYLADRGIAVLRFDFRGQGDSDRCPAATSLADMLDDLHAAAAWLGGELGSCRLHLFGQRLGGSLALMEASALGAASVALLSPIASGRDYLMGALRSNLTTQMSIHGRVQQDRQALISSMRETGRVNIDGYQIGAGLFDDISAIDLVASPPEFSGPGLVLSLPGKGRSRPEAAARKVFDSCLAQKGDSRLEVLDMPQPWRAQPAFQTRAPALFDRLADWLGGEVGR